MGAGDFSLLLHVQTGSRASHPMGTGGKVAGAWSWPLTSSKCWGQECMALYLHPQYVFMACCLVKRNVQINLNVCKKMPKLFCYNTGFTTKILRWNTTDTKDFCTENIPSGRICIMSTYFCDLLGPLYCWSEVLDKIIKQKLCTQFPAEVGIFLTTISRLALGPTHPPFQWIGIKAAGAWSWSLTFNWVWG
jgi:hypothetical protein